MSGLDFQKISQQSQTIHSSDNAINNIAQETILEEQQDDAQLALKASRANTLKAHEEADAKSATKAGNTRTKRSKDDIKSSQNSPSSNSLGAGAPQEESSAKTPKTGSGSDLFKTWLGDAMTLFMFDNAPILMRLSFELRDMLSKSQTIEAKAQMASAQASAQAKREEGVSDAKKCTLSAQSEMAAGIGGAIQGGMGIKDEMLHNSAYENELANHDAIHADLNTGKAAVSSAALEGSTVENLNSEEGLTEAEKVKFRELDTDEKKAAFKKDLSNEKIAKLAQDYHAAYHDAFNEELDNIKNSKVESARAKAAASNLVGFGKSSDMIADEQRLVASEKAGKTASENVLKNADEALLEKIKSDPKSAELFMKNLGNSSEEALGAIRGMDRNFRTQMLRSHGQAEGSAGFKADVARMRDTIAHKSNIVSSYLKNGSDKRQMLFNILTSSTSAGTGLMSADQIIKSAVKEAISKGQDAISAVMQAARGAQDGTIQGALAQVQALMDWYSQMESQVIGAVSQSMA